MPGPVKLPSPGGLRHQKKVVRVSVVSGAVQRVAVHGYFIPYEPGAERNGVSDDAADGARLVAQERGVHRTSSAFAQISARTPRAAEAGYRRT